MLFGSPFLMLSERQGLAPAGPLTVVLATLVLMVFAGAYFFFAVAGHRTARSPRMRRLGAALIGFQAAAGAWALSASSNPQVLIAAAPLLCVSVFLFMAFIWPGEAIRHHRPMRRRDQSPLT